MRGVLLIILFSFELKAEWYTFMGNNSRTAWSNSFIEFPLVERWSVKLPGEIVSSPIIYGGKVFITTRSGYIIALNLSDGQWVWDYSTNGSIDTTPVAYKNLLFVTSSDGYLYAFDLDESGKNDVNGVIKWRYNFNSASVSSPLIFKDKLYVLVGFPENALYIINAINGGLIRNVSFEKSLNSYLSLCDGRVVFGGQDGRIYLFDTEGNKIAEYPTKRGAFFAKAFSCMDGKIYSLPGYDERRYYVFNSTNLSLLNESVDLTGNYGREWNWQETSSVALSSSSVFFVAGSGNKDVGGGDAYAFFADKDGVILSSYVVGSVSGLGFQSSPLVVGDKVFITSNLAKFYAFSSTGAVIYQADISPSNSSPGFSGGYLVISSFDGRVKAFEFSKYISISSPSDDDVITSSALIRISTKGIDIHSYEISYSFDDISYTLISSGSLMQHEYLWDVSGLSNGRCRLKVAVFDSSSNLIGLSSVNVYINNKPLPPSNLTAIDNPNDNCNRIKLSWQPSQTPSVKYKIYRKSQTTDWTFIAESSSTTYIDHNAVCGTTFTYTVSSYDGWLESIFSNTSSAFSISDNPLDDKTAPAKITDLSSTKGARGGEVVLFWPESGDDGYIGKASYYEVRYTTYLPFDWQSAVSVGTYSVIANPGEIESVVIKRLLSKNTYYFSVSVCDLMQNCSEASNTVAANPQIDILPPSPPLNLSAYDNPYDRGGSIILSWQKSYDDGEGEDDVYGYMVFRTTTPFFDFSKPYDYLPQKSTSYKDNSATTGVRFCYVVACYDSTNISTSSKVCAISYDNYRFVSKEFGEVVVSDDDPRAQVFFNKVSLNQDDYVILRKIDKSEVFSPALFKNSSGLSFKPTSLVYELKSSNITTKILGSIRLEIGYSFLDIGDIDENLLRVYYYDGSRWHLNKTSSVDTENKKVYADINLFGVYGVFGYIPQGSVFDESFIYTYPNPAKGDKLTFKFVVNYNSDIEINVYNVAGEKIKSFEMKNAPAGVINEVVWDIKEVASGVYVYVFKATSSAGKKSIKKKLAIIH